MQKAERRTPFGIRHSPLCIRRAWHWASLGDGPKRRPSCEQLLQFSKIRCGAGPVRACGTNPMCRPWRWDVGHARFAATGFKDAPFYSGAAPLAGVGRRMRKEEGGMRKHAADVLRARSGMVGRSRGWFRSDANDSEPRSTHPTLAVRANRRGWVALALPAGGGVHVAA
jgi:hypothetical protein